MEQRVIQPLPIKRRRRFFACLTVLQLIAQRLEKKNGLVYTILKEYP